MTRRLFHEDPYLLAFDASVVTVCDHEGRPAVVLDATAFYAESGGQPWDTGRLGEARVLAVVEAPGGDILHVVDRSLAMGPVKGQVDGARRADHRQQHHGQLLFSRAFLDVAEAATSSFHLGGEVSSIDLDRFVGEAQIDAAESRANEIVWSSRPVSVRVVTRAEALAAGLTPPADAGDEVRLVEAEGFDRQPCGGTHPRNTAEVGVVLVTGQERYKGGTRVSFVCGHRARKAFRDGARALDAIGSALSVPSAGAAAAVARLVEQQAVQARRMADLLEQSLAGEARRLLAENDGSVVIAAYEGWSPTDLRTLALHLVRLRPCLALLGSREDKAHLVFAQADGLAHDEPALLREALPHVNGRGGGRGNVAQGGGDRLEGLDAALQEAARRAATSAA